MSSYSSSAVYRGGGDVAGIVDTGGFTGSCYVDAVAGPAGARVASVPDAAAG